MVQSLQPLDINDQYILPSTMIQRDPLSYSDDDRDGIVDEG